MSNLLTQQAAITRDSTCIAALTGATPADALVSTVRPNQQFWQQAVDEMLRWKSGRIDDDDRPDESILETAIDYAVDQLEAEDGDPAPCSIVLSGGGRIAMEWNDDPFAVIIEFVALGTADYIRFKRGRVESKQRLVRNPRSRKLELRG